MILEKSDIKAQTNYGNTALHYAIMKESITAVEQLLKHKDVDVNVNNNDNLTPLHFASLWPKIPIHLFKMILEKSDIKAQDNRRNTALHLAISNESITAVEELLKHKDVDVNVKNNDNLTPLHFVSLRPKIPIHLFKMILEKSDIKAQDNHGNTALYLAIWSEFKTGVEELLKHKDVDVNVKNNDNFTPLHYASLRPTIPIHLFKMILEKSDIKAQTNYGDTALHLAISNESTSAIEELLKHKDVDVNVKNNNSLTAFHLASHWKSIPDKLFKIISEKSRDVYVQNKYP
jgi:E3 ubiquitin-protein ligase mind-bomb